MSECAQHIYLHNSFLKECRYFSDIALQTGITLYEVVRIINGKPLFLSDHHNRLCQSATKINWQLNFSLADMQQAIQLLISNNNTTEGNIKFAFNQQENNINQYIYFIAHNYPTSQQYKNGVTAITYSAERNTPTTKVYNHPLRSSANKVIAQKNIYEIILVNSNNHITEGSRSNLFFIKNNELYTAPDSDVLPGIARSKVIDIAKKQNITLHKQPVSINSLSCFDSAFITGTSPMVLPISKIDNIVFDTQHKFLQLLYTEYLGLTKEQF